MLQFAQTIASQQGFLDEILSLIDKGGVFIYFIILCSVALIAVILYQSMLLRRQNVVPDNLVQSIDKIAELDDDASASSFEQSMKMNPSVLQKLCVVVLERHKRKDVEIQEAVQVIAREEIHKLQVGIPFLEVIITISPLLGLLGTATGLFTVFEGVGAGDEQYEVMALGIAEALITTVAGLAVAVPAVIAHGYFTRKIDSYATRLEVVMDKFVGAFSSSRRSN